MVPGPASRGQPFRVSHSKAGPQSRLETRQCAGPSRGIKEPLAGSCCEDTRIQPAREATPPPPWPVPTPHSAHLHFSQQAQG